MDERGLLIPGIEMSIKRKFRCSDKTPTYVPPFGELNPAMNSIVYVSPCKASL